MRVEAAETDSSEVVALRTRVLRPNFTDRSLHYEEDDYETMGISSVLRRFFLNRRRSHPKEKSAHAFAAWRSPQISNGVGLDGSCSNVGTRCCSSVSRSDPSSGATRGCPRSHSTKSWVSRRAALGSISSASVRISSCGERCDRRFRSTYRSDHPAAIVWLSCDETPSRASVGSTALLAQRYPPHVGRRVPRRVFRNPLLAR